MQTVSTSDSKETNAGRQECSISTVGQNRTGDGTKSTFGREAQKGTRVKSEGQDPKSGGARGLDGGKTKKNLCPT